MPGAMLKVRTNPGILDAENNDDHAQEGRILGRIGEHQCVIGLATSGDWLQVRYGYYEAAWTLLRYKERTLLAPFSDVHPGVAVDGDSEGGNEVRKGRIRESPFAMPEQIKEGEQG